MSSAKIDDKIMGFEINSQKTHGYFSIQHIDGHIVDQSDWATPDPEYAFVEDCIKLEMYTQSHQKLGQISTESRVSLLIPKSKTIVMSHIFKSFAERIDKWYTFGEHNRIIQSYEVKE